MKNVVVKVDASVGAARADHPTRIAADEELRSDLKTLRDVTFVARGIPEEGSKGLTQDLLLAIGTPTAAASTVKIIALWLGRDRRRSAEVEIDNGTDSPTKIKVTTDVGSDELLRTALEEAIKNIRDGSTSDPSADAEEQ
jgi:hypothetical protein